MWYQWFTYRLIKYRRCNKLRVSKFRDFMLQFNIFSKYKADNLEHCQLCHTWANICFPIMWRNWSYFRQFCQFFMSNSSGIFNYAENQDAYLGNYYWPHIGIIPKLKTKLIWLFEHLKQKIYQVLTQKFSFKISFHQ